MEITNEVANVLANSRIEGNNLYLPEGQLERKLYVAVNKVLESIKGKWSRKEKAHIFSDSPLGIVEEILLTGEYIDEKKEYQFFETPIELAKQLVQMANIQEGETVLEPSAGKGRIAGLITGCDCIELNPDNQQYLKDNGFNIIDTDFLSFWEDYDVIVANPPFSKQQDIAHVKHMIGLAKRRVVSVMSASVLFRDNKKTVDFRNLIEELGGTIEPLPDNIFAESGTNVKTCVVCVDTEEYHLLD
jgi:type I restriction-modification system DNA methylase subunit